jgi:ketosteroid isomerase-like protein
VLKWALAALLFLRVPAVSAHAQQRQDSASAVRSIRTALANWVEAANREDWRTASQVWAPDLVGWYPGQPDDTYAREMERAAHPPQGRPHTRYEVNVAEVIVSGPVAVVRDIWRFTTSPGTPDSTVSVVRSYEVWRRQAKGEWKIARWISAPEPDR